MTDALHIVSGVFLALGCVLILTGALGILRFPDVYNRLHAAGITETLAAAMLLGALMLQAGWSIALLKLGMILMFMLFTTPSSTHALAKAAWRERARENSHPND